MNTPQWSGSMLAGGTPAQAVRIAELEAQVVALQTEMQSLTATNSRDLRAPLRHTTSFAQLVQDEVGPQLNAEMWEFLGHASGAVKSLGRMLDGLLALSRIGTVALPDRSRRYIGVTVSVDVQAGEFYCTVSDNDVGRTGGDVGISATVQGGCQVVLRLPLASAGF